MVLSVFGPFLPLLLTPNTTRDAPPRCLPEVGKSYLTAQGVFAERVEPLPAQFLWEMFNVSNTPAFGRPGTFPGSGCGRITSTWGGGTGFEASDFGYSARVMQAALKLYW